MPKEKIVNYELVDDESEAYDILTKIRKAHHQDLNGCRIVLVWQTNVKPDRDGRFKLGWCRKRSDLDKEMFECDFIIGLNRLNWNNLNLKQKQALIDHELCHIAPDLNLATGKQKQDDRDRLLWRIRKHDIEEFRAVVERHGCYLRDIEEFVEAVRKAPSLFNKQAGKEAG